MISLSLRQSQTTTFRTELQNTLRQDFQIVQGDLGIVFRETRTLLKESKFKTAVEIISERMKRKRDFNSLTDRFVCMVFPDFKKVYLEMSKGKAPHLIQTVAGESLDDVDELLVQALGIALWHAGQENPTLGGFRKCLEKYI